MSEHDRRWIGLVSMPCNRRTKRGIVEFRDVTEQRTIDRMPCTHRHRSSAAALACARKWADDLNAKPGPRG